MRICPTRYFARDLALHRWRWGNERDEVFGTLEEGSIVVLKSHDIHPADMRTLAVTKAKSMSRFRAL